MLRRYTPALLLLAFVGSGALSASVDAAPASDRPLVVAANGCGRGFFRTIADNCEPNAMVRVGPGRAVILPPPCPPGFRRDPNPRRPICYPVY